MKYHIIKQKNGKTVITKSETLDLSGDSKGLFWVDCHFKNAQDLSEIKNQFNLHPLEIEDATNGKQQPVYNVYDNHLSLVIKSIDYENGLKWRHTLIILGKNYVLTLHKHELPAIKKIFSEIEKGGDGCMKNSADFLLYYILDHVVERYFPVLDAIEDRIESVEENAIKKTGKKVVKDIFKTKKELLLFRKAVWPARDIFAALQRTEGFIQKKNHVYFRDLYDHVSQIIDLIGTYRDLLSGALELHMSNVSNAMNEIMKILTIVASLMMIPTLIAGIYGMNYELIPSQSWPYSFHFAISLMLLAMAGMLLYFRRKNWL